MSVQPDVADDEVWDSATGETFGEARKRFATFGSEVEWQLVPDLVRAGFTVWSFGYGDDPQNFTSIEPDDLVWFEDEKLIAEWAPFRVDLREVLTTVTDLRQRLNEPLDLEWGEPGDCWERIVEDEDTRDAIKEAFEDVDLPYYADADIDRIVAAAKSLGLGKHYGIPHCIYCLQGE